MGQEISLSELAKASQHTLGAAGAVAPGDPVVNALSEIRIIASEVKNAILAGIDLAKARQSIAQLNAPVKKAEVVEMERPVKRLEPTKPPILKTKELLDFVGGMATLLVPQFKDKTAGELHDLFKANREKSEKAVGDWYARNWDKFLEVRD